MRLARVHVKHFRSIQDEVLEFGGLTAIVGANGTGKSSFLRALHHFYEGGDRVTLEDFYNRDPKEPIEITATFADLSEDEKERLGHWVAEGALQVTLRIQYVEDTGRIIAAYHGTRPAHPPFEKIRAGGGQAPDKCAELAALSAGCPEKYGFPAKIPSWTRAEELMCGWESEHPEALERVEDDGRTFKAPNSGAGPPATGTQLILVPAVRDVAEEASSPRSTMGRLIALATGDISSSDEVRDLTDKFTKAYRAAARVVLDERLPQLESRLNSVLGDYIPDATVTLEWDVTAPSLSPPTTSVMLNDGFVGSVDGKGHGLQRLLLVSLLQAAVAVSDEATRTGTEQGASLAGHRVLAIEEPELYQHPLQARRLFSTLERLASSDDEHHKDPWQVIYCTHSPWFVSVERFEDVRLARKVEAGPAMPRTTRITSVRMEGLMARVEQAFPGRAGYAKKRFASQMASVMDAAVNEGLFARSVVLVEGIEDQAIITAGLRLAGCDPDQNGLAIIPAGGKPSLDRPYVVFDALGIRPYLVFDADQNKSPSERHDATNEALLRLTGHDDYHDFSKVLIDDKVAMFPFNLRTTLSEEMGLEQFNAVTTSLMTEMGWDGDVKHPPKSTIFCTELMDRLYATELHSKSLNIIIDTIVRQYVA